MQKTTITLSVFHDGQFFTALFERTDTDGYSVAKRIFPAKPSDQEILAFVCDNYARLQFSPTVRNEERQGVLAKNPKRRQREAAKAMKVVCHSTKAQEALKNQRSLHIADAKHCKCVNKRVEDDERFIQRTKKRKQKHKGR